MQKKQLKNTLLCVFYFLFSSACTQEVINKIKVITGAERTEQYVPLLAGKNVALVANQTSLIGNIHLTDSLLKLNIKVIKIFCPEHGFRGQVEAGAYLTNEKDLKTGLPVVSLYGEKHRKPLPEDLRNIDMVIFDIQDVGVRFYTYISTLHYVMEACAENHIEVIVLDRPNPNGFYVDGPMLETGLHSFVGMHPVPLVHGMTVGEYAGMINGEGWLINGLQCKLKVISCLNYSHSTLYSLPEKPSPNLPCMTSIYLYPSLGLFEGTIVSVGRGTDFPFQIYGYPSFKNAPFSFTPQSIPGVSANPPYMNTPCLGYDLRTLGVDLVMQTKRIQLQWLINAYNEAPDKNKFFNSFFCKLAGTKELQQQIQSGMKTEEIYKTWENGLRNFKEKREKYLLYKDFE